MHKKRADSSESARAVSCSYLESGRVRVSGVGCRVRVSGVGCRVPGAWSRVPHIWRSFIAPNVGSHKPQPAIYKTGKLRVPHPRCVFAFAARAG
jgi:hypothetical protein